MMTGRKLLGVCALVAAVMGLDVLAAQPVPKMIFGQNIEHTRSCVQGGLSAELVRNRKFAGKPLHTGVAQGWERYGGRGVFVFLDSSYTRHAKRNDMWRLNERHSQQMTSLDPAGEAGITQDRIALRAGVGHTFRVVARVFRGGAATLVLRVKQDGQVIAEQRFAERGTAEFDWKPLVLKFTPAKTGFGAIEIGVLADRSCVVGAVSVMADDNFHGMRPDVVAHLAEIGTSIVRWPGGCFASDYRWRDGYIADRDARAPIQSFAEIETQPYTYGYDSNDLSTDDILALCEKLGAEPFFTLNVAFETPADAVEWMKRTNGKVKRWSLGNEFGYPGIERPKSPQEYAAMVRPHAEAMRQVDPAVRVTAAGRYSAHSPWIEGAAVPLSNVVQSVAYHDYSSPGQQVFCTSVPVKLSYAAVQHGVKVTFDRYHAFRAKLPAPIRVSLDEWNLWAAWYREDGPVDGLYTLSMLHRFMKEWEQMGLEDICYFQAINENAIRVTPFESHLTTLGHAFRLAKDHVGNLPVAGAFPTEVFATDAPDGTRYVTCLNFKPYESCTYTVPAGACTKIVGGELLEANGVATGAQFVSKQPTATLANGTCTITVPPASLIAVRLGMSVL